MLRFFKLQTVVTEVGFTKFNCQSQRAKHIATAIAIRSVKAENVMLALRAIATERNAFFAPRFTTPGWRGGYHSGMLNKWLKSHQSAMDTLVGHTNSGSNPMEKLKRRLKYLLMKQNGFTRYSVFFFYSALLLFQRTLIFSPLHYLTLILYYASLQ